MGMAIPAAILGGTGLLGGLYSAKVAQENNEDQIDFAQWSQKDSQYYNQLMYDKAVKDQRDMYEKYQSPQAIAKSLRAAGLNPSAMNGSLQGGSIPSVPSTPHSSPVATPQLQNEGSAFAQSLQSIGSAFSSLSSAELQDAQTNESRSLLNEKLNQLILQNNGQQLMNAKSEFDTYAAQQKLPYEINELINDCYLKYYQGKHSDALASLVEVQEKIANKEFDIKSEEAATIGMMLQKQLGLLDENIKLTQAKQLTERSQQSANYASASYSKALARTENALRSGRIELQSLSADLATLDKYLRGNELKFSDSTLDARTFGIIEQMYREGLISENVYKEGQILSTKRDWASRQEFANYLSNVCGAATSVMNAYSNYRGVSVSRLNAKERNAIQRDFVDEYIRQSKQNSSAKRGAVLGPDWEMYSDQFFGR